MSRARFGSPIELLYSFVGEGDKIASLDIHPAGSITGASTRSTAGLSRPCRGTGRVGRAVQSLGPRGNPASS